MASYLTSYATPRFERAQRELHESALLHGVFNVHAWKERELHHSEFYQKNKGILDSVCGAGYWAWKPYFILRALAELKEGDVLFYCDAGSRFLSSPNSLIDLCRASATGLTLFDARPLTNRQFTKRDCFVRLGCDRPQHWDAFKVIATILVLRRTPFVSDFLNEWLTYCQDRAAISDDENGYGLPNLDEFLCHRHDQAILSLLASKHGLETFRNPTVWGNYLKLPAFRVPGEAVVSPYGLNSEIRDYAAEPQTNSPYGTLFEINRLPNYVGKRPMPEGTDHRDGASSTGRARRFAHFSRRFKRKLQAKFAR